MIEVGRDVFCELRYPKGGDNSGEDVHGVMRAQDQDGSHFEQDD
jgi:hypothetical protein